MKRIEAHKMKRWERQVVQILNEWPLLVSCYSIVLLPEGNPFDSTQATPILQFLKQLDKCQLSFSSDDNV